MKKEITTKQWFCDVCGRQGGYYGKCLICGKEYCHCCEFIGYNPTYVRICKEHQKDDEMKDRIAGFQDKYNKLKEEVENKLLEEKDKLKEIVKEKIENNLKTKHL